MKAYCTLVGLIVSALTTAPLGIAQTQTGAASSSAVFAQYCVVCHDNQKRTAGVSLQGLDLSKIGEHAQLLERVLRKVNTGQMPPAGMPRPDATRMAAFSRWLEQNRTSVGRSYANELHRHYSSAAAA